MTLCQDKKYAYCCCYVALEMGAKYCGQCVCVSFCLSAHISQKHVQVLLNVWCMLPVAVDGLTVL